MQATSVATPASQRGARLIWALTTILIVIGLAAVTRRSYVLLNPLPVTSASPAAALDEGFSAQSLLTFAHILPAALYFILMPFQFVPSIRARHITWHRWSGRLLVALGLVVGVTALVMSFTMNVGGVSETAATTFYAILFLIFLGLGFWNILQRRIPQHRVWMLRAFGVSLGIATTRPIVGAFFAARRLSPHEFFGAAFWLGFTTTLIATEGWIRFT